MSLAGLLSVIAADPQLQRALSQGDADTDLVAPPALRPFLAASIAGYPSADQPRFVLAVTATARADDPATVGAVAERSGARELILTHYLPAEPEAISPLDWAERASAGFSGVTTAGTDGLRRALPSVSG